MSFTHRTADATAIGLSGLCLAHCLALPLMASLIPLAGAGHQADWVHWLFVAIAAPIAVWSLSRPHPKGLSRAATVLAGLGLLALVAAAAEFPSHGLATPITVVGALMLAGGHILNWRHKTPCC